MALLLQSSFSWFSSSRMLPPTRLKSSKLCCAMNPDSEESSEVINSIKAKKVVPVDRVKLAFEKAKAYKESMKSNSGFGIEETSGGEDNSVKENPNVVDGGEKDVPVWLKIAMETAEKNRQNKGVVVSETDQGLQGGSERKSNSGLGIEKSSGGEDSSVKENPNVAPVDRVKLAFEKAKAYKESMKSNPGLGIEESSGGEDNSVKENPNVVDGGEKDVPVWLKIAMEKAEKNRQNKGVVSETDQGLQGGRERKSNSGLGIEKSSGGEDNSVKENPKVVPVDRVKLAFEKAKAYKESMKSNSGLGIEKSSGDEDNLVKENPKVAPVDRVKLAFEKAKAYKESMKSNSGFGIEETSGGEDNSVKENPNVVDGGANDVPVWLKIAMETAEKNRQNKGVVVSETDQGLQGGSERKSNSGLGIEKSSGGEDSSVKENPIVAPVDRVKLAFEKAKAYKESMKSNSGLGIEESNGGEDNSVKENPKVAPVDRVKLAFEKAKAYKESLKSNSGLGIEESSGGEDNSVKENPNVVDGGEKDVPLWLKIAMETAEKNRLNKGVVSETDQGLQGGGEMKSNSGLGIEKSSGGKDNSVKENPNVVDGGEKDVPVWLKIAMETAEKNRQNKGAVASETDQGLQGGSERTWGENMNDSSVGKKEKLSVSKLDFVGLDFADKRKRRGLPPGLVPISDPYLDCDLPEVELIVGDKTKFGAKTTAPQPEQTAEDESDLYKPKVSTWGVFPRPNNISKTFGGGRVIRPGEVLETAEEKAAKEERTKQILAAYKKKHGLNIDPKLKAECQEELNKGDLLMEAGKLKAALPYYEKVIDKLPFESELHGLAALQWAICLDSLTRHNEARSMYEKLKSHPNGKVGKKARQFMYSFEAMEMLKVKIGSSSYSKDTSYQSYFDAFVEKKTNYTLKVKDEVVQESSMNQVILYILFLTSPIFVVLLLAVQKRI
ncbi:unnamed protein product [Lathyrus sativus]|nr:unnamed protein product [Lathyrus sativus]